MLFPDASFVDVFRLMSPDDYKQSGILLRSCHHHHHHPIVNFSSSFEPAVFFYNFHFEFLHEVSWSNKTMVISIDFDLLTQHRSVGFPRKLQN